MRKNTLFNIAFATAILTLASCNDKDGTVSISGKVADAKGEKLALMHLAGNNPVLVDTLTLDEAGNFKFKPTVEQGGPDFFCLVLNGQTIPVVSDTLQTPIVINTSKDRFSTAYTAEDSINNVLREATGYGNELRRSLYNLTEARSQNKVSAVVFADSVQSLVNSYKSTVLDKYIYSNPASPVSYYLLFETVSGMTIFDPYDLKDSRAYGAVANLWINYYPNSPRTAFLEQRTKEAIALRVQARREQAAADSLVEHAVVDAASFLDLKLIGTNDQVVPLSSINGKGDIVLLDFTAYYVTDASVPHNEVLSKVYNRFKGQGLKIYQVCLDPDVNFWKVSAANLPWTVVRDEDLLFDTNGLVQYSAAGQLYNISQVPTTFVMGRDGSPLVRIEDDSKLEAAVAKAM